MLQIRALLSLTSKKPSEPYFTSALRNWRCACVIKLANLALFRDWFNSSPNAPTLNPHTSPTGSSHPSSFGTRPKKPLPQISSANHPPLPTFRHPGPRLLFGFSSFASGSPKAARGTSGGGEKGRLPPSSSAAIRAIGCVELETGAQVHPPRRIPLAARKSADFGGDFSCPVYFRRNV